MRARAAIPALALTALFGLSACHSLNATPGAPAATPSVTTTTPAPATSAPAPRHRHHKPTPAPAPTATATPTTAECQYRWQGSDPLPDPKCTPGAVQSTDTAAICSPGWAEAHRVYFTKAEREAAFAKYGVFTTDPAGYGEYDHLVPLELGGSNDPSNLWPEPGKIPNVKDTIENIVHEQVCSGKIPLRLAQQEFMTDWASIPDTFQAS